MTTALSATERRQLRIMSETGSELPRAAIMDEIRAGLYRFGDMQMLANRTGFSRSCLESIRSGRTKWPRPVTIFTILPYLGLELRIVRTTQH